MYLNIAVVSLDSVDNFGTFLILTADIDTYLNVRAFNLVVKSLAYIVQKTGTSCKSCVNAKLACHYACEVSDLY